MLEKRFWSKVEMIPFHDCWEWTGKRNWSGYGIFNDKRAHRLSWEITNGKSPGKLFVCHKCDNPGCVNPKHLFLGTNVDNMNDKILKGRDRGFAALNRIKTHCKYGHELYGQNLLVRSDGGRRCRICKIKSRRERYLRIKK